MSEVQGGGDLEKIQVRNLATASAELLERAAASSGRSALTLTPEWALRSSGPCWRFGAACTWPTTTLLGQRRSRSCGAGCGW
jgi:hypothetical protein